jgi:hypothetical protein
MYTFTEVMPHGGITEVFPDVFFVTGTSRPNFQGTQWQYSRNMTIIRQAEALTLVNTVRLDDDGLKALDKLGKVKNVVRLGAMHGMDDAFYVDRYGAKLWALAGMEHESGLPTDVVLAPGPGNEQPVADSSLFVFATAKDPEGLLLLSREGGILIACDSLQNWVDTDQFFSTESAKMMSQHGFIKPANVGPGWRNFSQAKASDFVELKKLPFRHLLSAHGIPLRDDAHAQLSATFAELYGV